MRSVNAFVVTSCAQEKWNLNSKWNYISTFTELHVTPWRRTLTNGSGDVKYAFPRCLPPAFTQLCIPWASGRCGLAPTQLKPRRLVQVRVHRYKLQNYYQAFCVTWTLYLVYAVSRLTQLKPESGTAPAAEAAARSMRYTSDAASSHEGSEGGLVLLVGRLDVVFVVTVLSGERSVFFELRPLAVVVQAVPVAVGRVGLV